MKTKPKLELVLTAFIVMAVLSSGCSDEEVTTSEEPIDLLSSESRPFYMGVTPWPYDFTAEAQQYTYETIGAHTDLVAHHFDEGIPWPEALAGEPYHPSVRGAIDTRVGHLQEVERVYLAITPLSGGRDSLAGYWAEDGSMARPGEWADKDFDDPDVIAAYTNFARYMISRFNPDYMAYGIEVNLLAEKDPAAFQKYLVLAEQVYQTLKEEYPGLPLFLTIHIETFISNRVGQEEIIRQLLPFSDYVAVSSYPFVEQANPGELPQDWFSQMQDLAPDKPFAVAETGYIAQDLVLAQYGVEIQGRDEWQADYVRFLFDKANELQAEFVIWFVSRDYDLAWERVKAGVDEIFKLWRDTGLLDGDGNVRPSLQIWDEWLGLPVR